MCASVMYFWAFPWSKRSPHMWLGLGGYANRSPHLKIEVLISNQIKDTTQDSTAMSNILERAVVAELSRRRALNIWVHKRSQNMQILVNVEGFAFRSTRLLRRLWSALGQCINSSGKLRPRTCDANRSGVVIGCDRLGQRN